MYFLLKIVIFQPAMLVAGAVPWSLCILQENRSTGGGGVGGVGMMTFMHLHTFEMLRN